MEEVVEMEEVQERRRKEMQKVIIDVFPFGAIGGII